MISLLHLRTLVLAGVAAVLGWLVARAAPAMGVPTPVVGLSGLVTVAAVGVLCLVLGLRVRRDRDRPVAERMDPLAAARTLVLGQAAGFTGAVLAGWHAGAAVAVAVASGLDAPTARDALLLAVGGAVLMVVGVLVERWCRIPPEDDATGGGPRQDGGAGRGHGARPETEGGWAHGGH